PELPRASDQTSTISGEWAGGRRQTRAQLRSRVRLLLRHGEEFSLPTAYCLLKIVAQLLRAARVAQLAERLRFDLTDALAGHAELAPDLFERALAVVVEA